MLLTLNVSLKWKVTTAHKFNAVAYGKLFKENKESIITVGEDGVVQVYQVPSAANEAVIKPVRTLETKCGPGTHVLLKDITRLSPCDMLVADTRGAVVLFCDGQILVRRCSLTGKTARVTALEVQETGLGNVQVIVGRDDGELTCFNTFSQLWKIRIKDLSTKTAKKSISVTCILATTLRTSSGKIGDYVLVADSDRYLHVIENGEVLSSILLNSIVTAMASGRFLLTEDAAARTQSCTQVALGCLDGFVWILIDFCLDQSTPYASVGHPITHLRRVAAKHNYSPLSGGGDDGAVDVLVCGGHFHSLKIYQHGKVIHSFQLSSWTVSLCGFCDWMNEESREDDESILIGCQDSILQCITIT